jgi:hypothetical protein
VDKMVEVVLVDSAQAQVCLSQQEPTTQLQSVAVAQEPLVQERMAPTQFLALSHLLVVVWVAHLLLEQAVGLGEGEG